MLFQSFEFAAFFIIVLGVWLIIPAGLRIAWLLAASYCFYMGWNRGYALLLAAVTLVSWVAALWMEKFYKQKRYIFFLAVIVILSLLGFFKYSGFLLSAASHISESAGCGSLHSRLVENLVLPVGISFYSFQAVGYLADVYSGRIAPDRSLPRFALFLSFFPQLVAGPIERSGNLLKQLRRIRKVKAWDYDRICSGLIMMLWGYFMKLVVADRLAVPVDTVFGSYREQPALLLLLGAAFFSVQVYCDFASYSMIARGVARMLGFELMENFRAPFLSGSIREFWKRWHISLGGWLRDYIYIPLGGNRNGKWKTVRNTMAVFLVSGIWHGADWSFLVWGAVNGLAQVMENIWSHASGKERDSGRKKTWFFRPVRTIGVFIFISLAFVFFRADSLGQAAGYLSCIVKNSIKPGWLQSIHSLLVLPGMDTVETVVLYASIVILAIVDTLCIKRDTTADMLLINCGTAVSWGCIAGLVFAVFLFGRYGPLFDARAFIYFQF